MKTNILAIASIVFLSFSFSSFESKFYESIRNSGKSTIFDLLLKPDSSESEPEDDSTDNPFVEQPLLKDLSNMFNERGFYKSNGFSFDEQEIINDFNGNLMYNIPLYNYKLPGDLVFDVGLTYNGSVGHMFYIGDTNTYKNDTYGRYNMNFPEWILNIDGIGVQVLNFETNFFSNVVETGIIQKDNVHALIPGYQYSNQLSYPSLINPDRINILAGDGSVITLINDARDTSYSGYYSYDGKESYYKARVTFMDSTGFVADRNRRVELMKGDGLIFIFEETKIQFSDLTLPSLVSYYKRPKVLLLKYINDRYGNTISLAYTIEHPYQTTSIYGRPLLTSIVFNFGFSTEPVNSLNFIYGPQVLKIDHTSKLNGSYKFRLSTPVAFRPVEQITNYTNHRGMISEIKNILDQVSYIKYTKYVRTFSNVQNPGLSDVRVSFNNLSRLTNFKNALQGRRGYSYYQDDSIGVSLTQYYASEHYPIRSDFHRGYGRDPFYLNMISSIKDSSETGSPISSGSIDYVYSDEGQDIKELPVDSLDIYQTTRTKTSTIPGTSWDVSALSQLKTSSYRVYPLYDPAQIPPPDIRDISGSTKLLKENIHSNSSGDSVVNTYRYQLGYKESGIGFNGSFLLTQKMTKIDGKTKSNNYAYDYFENPITSLFDLPNKLVKQTSEADPFENISKTHFRFFLYEFTFPVFSSVNSGIYYKIQLQDTLNKFSPSNALIYKKSFSYINDTSSSFGYEGQLLSEKVYNTSNLSEFIETKYDYYKRDTLGLTLYGADDLPKKEGNIKSVTKPDGQVQKYFYHLTDISETDSLNPNSDFPNYPRFYYRIKYTNGTIKDSTEMIYDRRLPIRIDNYKVTGGNTDTLSRIYKTYTADGGPAKIIDQNRYLTEFKYEPMHRINSITLPGDFSTIPDSALFIIRRDSIEDVANEIQSDAWGQFIPNNGEVKYYDSHNYTEFNGCLSSFSMAIDHSNNNPIYAYIKLDNDRPRKYLSLDSAILTMHPLEFDATFNNTTIPQHDYKTYVKGITALGEGYTPIQGCTHWSIKTATLDYSNDTISLPTQPGCIFVERKFDIKRLFFDLGNRQKIVRGLTLNSVYTGDPGDPNSEGYDYPKFDLDMIRCHSHIDYWFNSYAPKVNIYGDLDLSDTLRIPIIKGGTIKYKYNDTNHTITVYSVRSAITNEYSKLKYSIDGFGNIKQKDIFTSESSSNSYKYKFNYLNKASVSFDALMDSTNFSYDGLERLIRTRNPDTSATVNSYSYPNNFSNYFGSVPGLVELQRFTDEEGNNFDKYFDAVGNLRREVKYIDLESGNPPYIALNTDYKYDSLYRVIQVRTPEGKDIFYTYDGYGRQSKRITPDAGTTDFIYDKNSNLIYSQDANQRSFDIKKYTFRNYDGINRLTGIGEALFEYDSPYDGIQYVPSTPENYLTVNVYDTISRSIVSNLFSDFTGYTSELNYTKGNLAATAYRTIKSDQWNFKYYRYDVRGRVIKMWNIISGFDTLITEYTYNSQDQITLYSHSGHGDSKTYKNEYDYAGRLQKVEYNTAESAPTPTYTNLTEYEYNPNSQISTQKYYDSFMQNDYSYNERNWITLMDNSAKLFEYSNQYFKNGNVKSMQLSGDYSQNFASPSTLFFDYKYDESNRLTEATSPEKYFEVKNTYDKDGNILTLDRFGSTGNQVDDFNYAYYSGTNKLQRVTGSGTQYTYDANGNMTSDALSKNSIIKYDHRNLITELQHLKYIPNDSITLYTYYSYDEAGNRFAKTVYKYTGEGMPTDTPHEESEGFYWVLDKTEISSRDVSGREMAIYKNDTLQEYPIYGLDMIGKIKENELYFYWKDHLGSVRVVTDAEANVINCQDYDPWGYILENRVYQYDESVFKFTSKERDEESFYDYSYARNYNSRLGIFNSPEPIPSSSFGWGSFVYCADNPLKIIDPSGEEWYYMYDEYGIRGKWEYYDEETKNIWTGRYDDKGNKIMELKQGYKELLYFQGRKLQWLKESGEIAEWEAVSGELDYYGQTNPILEHIMDRGPIPQGWWNVDPSNAYSIESSEGIIDYLKWKIVRKAPFGEAYINIYPTADNPATRREGFSIHGGEKPGSIGCIDLTGGMNNFYNNYVNHGKSMLLNVDYSNFTP